MAVSPVIQEAALKPSSTLPAPAQSSSTPPAAPMDSRLAQLRNQIASVKEQAALEAEAEKRGGAPVKVLDWAFDLGQVMLGALKDPQKAAPTYAFLKSCFGNADYAAPYRALCAANAKRLTVRYEDRFGRDFAQAQHDLPDQIYAFVQTVER